MTVKIVELKIRRPDDWHVHLRDDDMLRTVLPYTSRYFGRAIIMPNLTPPVTTICQAIAYRERIMAALPAGHKFTPLMTCYLTQSMNKQELIEGFKNNVFTAAKLYLANTTINSHYGVTDITKIYPILSAMQDFGIPLLMHGELNNPEIDIFDREVRFIEQVIEPIHRKFNNLKIVLEHITTKEAVDYVLEGNSYIGATITPQHLMFNRNHMLVGGIRPHLYCLPILKRSCHQKALRAAVASGFDRFFLGTDTAPHYRNSKESACGCAGIFNAPVALPAYATVFEELNALEYFEAFCSLNGPNFYGLPFNKEFISIKRKDTYPPELIYLANGETVVSFLAQQLLNWKVID
ncbi:dihydroorotase [Candidatus Palibaumannia cicadellinicola]|uniref:Dihydroorotase n=1 Tax=Candidatus Palibaumannia cicadellinicola TaxID=186490 RepID=A0A0K2BKR1_9GAMM|nr:dihydroorotase [Candidatus Baumannia cicadellinicola]AKZ65981.1 Dihydroorotase [Candidatus Baumannia cicadellinicola]